LNFSRNCYDSSPQASARRLTSQASEEQLPLFTEPRKARNLGLIRRTNKKRRMLLDKRPSDFYEYNQQQQLSRDKSSATDFNKCTESPTNKVRSYSKAHETLTESPSVAYKAPSSPESRHLKLSERSSKRQEFLRSIQEDPQYENEASFLIPQPCINQPKENQVS